MLKATDISFTAGGNLILDQVNTSFAAGKITMILGPNGSGKSTFLKIFSGEHKYYQGQVNIGDKPLRSYTPSALATFRAVLSQQPHLHFPLMAEEVVMMGRYPFFSSTPSSNDVMICLEAMQLLEIANLGKRNYLTLSGGEKQRVQYARVLAQIWEQPKEGNRYLFLDEPLNSLDIRYQQEFLRVARKFLDERTVIVAIIHDINLALQFGDHFLFMKQGKIVADGGVDVITPNLIRQVFDVNTRFIPDTDSGRPFIVVN